MDGMRPYYIKCKHPHAHQYTLTHLHISFRSGLNVSHETPFGWIFVYIVWKKRLKIISTYELNIPSMYGFLNG